MFFSGGAESFFPLLLDIASPNFVCPRGIDNDETSEEEEKGRQPGCVSRHPPMFNQPIKRKRFDLLLNKKELYQQKRPTS